MSLITRHSQCMNLRKDMFKETRCLKPPDTVARVLRTHNLVQFLGNPLTGKCFNSVLAFRNGFCSFWCNLEIVATDGQLALEADTAEHSQWVLTEPFNRVSNAPDNTVIKVIKTTNKVNQITKTTIVDVDAHGVDSKVPAHDIVLEGSIKHKRLP